MHRRLRAPLLVLGLLAAACTAKSDEYDPPGCTGAMCTTGVVATSETSDADPSDPDPSDPDPSDPDPSDSEPTGPDPTDVDASTSSATTTDGEAESSSTGEPTDNMYAPCTEDAECSSGLCINGFCTAICWSMVDGETPCPQAPAGAVGIEVTCDTIGFPSGPVCEGCLDCAQYCIANCDAESECPNGGTCVENVCAPALAHCGGVQ